MTSWKPDPDLYAHTESTTPNEDQKTVIVSGEYSQIVETTRPTPPPRPAPRPGPSLLQDVAWAAGIVVGGGLAVLVLLRHHFG